ncbi:uncharacterized protein LTR77_004549 [Saxophila tyrrhenica]|uniref:Uncharacterized protein n=1 Tax=Saxophila tyrrhenica TaxID=1690608 RepID=A0AAV9PDR9_9PEZI|nr:hypothetical protein LTR77_004549 [Saxophila tyrrhenica]
MADQRKELLPAESGTSAVLAIPAQELAADIVYGKADWPSMSQLRDMHVTEVDLEQAIFGGSICIVGVCDDILRKESASVHAKAVRTRWQLIKEEIENGIVRSGSTIHTFFECMQTVSKVRMWAHGAAVEAIVIERA